MILESLKKLDKLSMIPNFFKEKSSINVNLVLLVEGLQKLRMPKSLWYNSKFRLLKLTLKAQSSSKISYGQSYEKIKENSCWYGQKIVASGFNVLLIQKSIFKNATNDLSLHFLAKKGIMVVQDIERDDVEFIRKTT